MKYLPTSTLLMIISGIFLFAFGYLLGKNSDDSTAMKCSPADLSTLNHSMTEMKKVEAQLKDVTANLEKTANKLSEIPQTLDNQWQILSQKMAERATIVNTPTNSQSLSTESSPAPQGQETTSAEKPSSDKSQSVSELNKLVDQQAINEMLDKVHTADLLEREKAFKTLLAIGSPQIKQQIGNLILDENEDSSIRQSAIEAMDWQGSGEILVQLMRNTGNVDVRGSAIYAAEKSNLSPDEKVAFEQSLTEQLLQEREDVPKAAILDYFAQRGPESFDNLLNNIPVTHLPVELQEHIQFLKRDLGEAPATQPTHLPQ